MASENETVKAAIDAVRKMIHDCPAIKSGLGVFEYQLKANGAIDRIEAAHRREVAELKRLHDIHAKQAFRDFDRKLFFRDKRIAELRECLKPILAIHLCDGGTQPVSDALCAVAECKSRWRKALEGAKDEGK